LKKHYLRIAKDLDSYCNWIKEIDAKQDLPDLHKMIVELKTSLPETVAYENSKLLLDGLRVTTVDEISEYTIRLLKRITELIEYYRKKASR
jgi:hypothetical protein